MYTTILNLHSYFAFIVLAILILAVINAISGLTSKRDFNLSKDFRVSLFALILSHLQLLIGLILFFVSPNGLEAITTNGMGGLSSAARLLAVEHPFINIIAIVFITIGWSKHKKVMESAKKFKLIAIFYGLGLLCLLSRIPWGQWF
ncbi:MULTISPECIES: hypothetical protein [Cellulophaga]|uniref:50S ribosomal protein L27 n=2 Tax=Cellulophaga TaxID=104264 RepID=F0REV9_CELLC|nr:MULTISPECIES: hypothetical protein [Cellulophaga]ADY28914.1 hypothetical protein Celly_1085 [Cellulophaga lytica DSM 7489]AIM59960.1 hypothetical protein IX49_05290 [Cellulophaga lytica]APU09823.1 hypothetical protein A5M85_05870 [Cellulophaga lytica]EWH13290.1 hypothetical protein KLA_10213 [Cellulophaga geojensis KL-A]MDO6854449.1 hypothetical protein [Cellulophaga lytica]